VFQDKDGRSAGKTDRINRESEEGDVDPLCRLAFPFSASFVSRQRKLHHAESLKPGTPALCFDAFLVHAAVFRVLDAIALACRGVQA
jgi:hypothetical protein